MSSTEAEYRALTTSACEAIWLRRLLSEIDYFDESKPTTIYCDNQSVQALAKNLVYHSRTKHIDVREHFIRERVLLGDITLQHCDSKENVMDIFTKPLGKELFEKHQLALGLTQRKDIPIKGV